MLDKTSVENFIINIDANISIAINIKKKNKTRKEEKILKIKSVISEKINIKVVFSLLIAEFGIQDLRIETADSVTTNVRKQL